MDTNTQAIETSINGALHQQQQYNNQYNLFNPYYTTQNYSFYNTGDQNTPPKEAAYHYQDHYQSSYYNNYQQQYYNNNSYPTSMYQPQTETNLVEPVRTNTPDKPIMNDSGLGISPEVALVTGPQSVAQSQSQSTSDDEDDCDESIDNIETGKQESRSSSLMKPPKPYLEIIADAILTASDHMMQLHEIYHYMSSKYAYFAKNVNKSWRNSVRHNLSLNECFVKAGRGSNGKGNYWKIHSACEPDFIRGNFRRKNFKILIRQTNGAKQQQQQQQQKSTLSSSNNPFNSLNYFNTQLQSLGIGNFLNTTNYSSTHQRPTANQQRYQPY